MKIRFSVLLLLIIAACAMATGAFPVLKNGEPPCASWTRADAVFSGKILKIEEATKSEDLPAGTRKVRFQVTQNFKGADNPTISIFATAASAGGMNLKKGETWIIYAMNDIVVKSFSAFRGVRIDPKLPSDELEALQSVVSGKSSGAISGQFVSEAAGGKYLFDPVEITVESGGRRFSGKTDPGGAFNIPVPDGNYRIELKMPYKAGVKWDENLLGAALVEGVPTVFRYDVRLNDGDCHFGFFEVSRRTD